MTAPFAALVVMLELAVNVVRVTPEAVSELAVMSPPTLHPFPTVLLEVETVSAPRRTKEPTASPKTTVPAPALTVRSWEPAERPFIVLEKVIVPGVPVVTDCEAPDKVTGAPKVIDPVEEVTLDPVRRMGAVVAPVVLKLIDPLLDVETFPARLIPGVVPAPAVPISVIVPLDALRLFVLVVIETP